MEKNIIKIRKKIKKYLVEIIILTIAFIIAVISLIIFLKNQEDSSSSIISQKIETQSLTKIYVDVSGSVNKPDLYEAPNNARLKELIEKAGGLSDNADKNFFSRNFNLARIVVDQEKIYIPSVWEVQNGYFTENPQTLNYLYPLVNNQKSLTNDSLININSASIEELDTLPGIGKITAQKIIDNRPFEALEELLNKKIINKSVFENIKSLITL